jgi:hypothetical protein
MRAAQPAGFFAKQRQDIILKLKKEARYSEYGSDSFWLAVWWLPVELLRIV